MFQVQPHSSFRRHVFWMLCALPALSGCTAQSSQLAARERMAADVVDSLYQSAPQNTLASKPTPDASDDLAIPKGFVKPARGGNGAAARALGVNGNAAVQESAAGNVTLNFVNADLVSVIEAILGERLGENYLIDDGLEGKVTLQTNRPLNRAQLLSTLQEILSMNDAALMPGDGVYKIVQGTGRQARSATISFDDAVSRGLTVRVTPLTHSSAASIARTLESFAPANGRIDVDQDRNLIFSVATPAEQRSIMDIIAVLDVDYLSNMAFALEPLKNARAEVVATELETITAEPGASEGSSGALRFLAIDRMNAVLIIAKSNTALSDARNWITRLDQGAGDGQQLFVYPVKNRRAEELAKIVGRVFAVQAGVESATSGGLAPGLQQTTLSDTAALQDTRFSNTNNTNDGNIFGSGTNGDSDVRVIADNATNSLIIYADYANYRPIKTALDRLDILPVQVLIEATLIEVSLSNELEYGVRWFFQNGQADVNFNDVASQTGTTGSNPLRDAINPASPAFNFVFDSTDVRFVLSALRQVTDVEFLSAPTMMVLDNQIARLQVGDEVPVQTRSAVSTIDPNAPIVNDIEYRDTGVILSVRPKVTSDGLVVMEIVQEVSEVVRTVTSGIVSPTIQQRRFDSTVAVASGETVVLGGLTSRNTSLGRTGVPILSSIPVLGNAFTSRANVRARTELLVMITPRVIRDPAAARAATDEMRLKLADMFKGQPSQATRLLNPMRTLDGTPRDIIEDSPVGDLVVPKPIPKPDVQAQ